MKITKIGHCCLLIEHKGKRILTDPGSYTIEDQQAISDLDLIFITHEHQDHFHLDSLKELLKINKNAEVWTNSAVGELLKAEGIPFKLIKDGDKPVLADISFEVIGKQHAEIYTGLPRVENTGFVIDNLLFYPGDALSQTETKFTTLALPVAGPWLKLSEVIDYALALQPKICFPVHDGMLNTFVPAHTLPPLILEKFGIKFVPLEAAGSIEI